MNFSTKAEYGLRAMVLLTKSYDKGPYSLAEIAKKEEVSLPYLERLIAKLRENGLVQSTRGIQGGYELAKEPAQITILQIVRALEGEMVPAICVFETGPVIGQCKRVQDCEIRGVWKAVQKQLDETLGKITLGDLVKVRLSIHKRKKRKNG